MLKRTFSGIMFTLLLTSMLTLADIDVTTSSNDHAVRQAADGQDSSLSVSPHKKFWDFDEAIEWGNFAKVSNGSTEMIIGINYAKPNGYGELRQFITENQGEVVNTVSMNSKIMAAVAGMPVAVASTFAEEVRTNGFSRYVEPNLRFQGCLVPNDPYWQQQWGPVKIEADYAWNTTIGDQSVLVAVIDTGIDYGHPDLAANYVPLGYDWVNNDTDPLDDYGHGTHCAGIIAATLDNNIGMAGTAQVRIMAEKGLDSTGSGYASDLANAIIHAVDEGAHILSNSWGGLFYSDLIHDAVKYAQDHGVLVVAAAGNDASKMKNYPAAHDEVVAVTATNKSDDAASFTSYGKWVDVAAPGVDIYSTMPTYNVTLNNFGFNLNYDYLNGTSMACPHAAGVAALIWSEFPSLTRDEVRLRLQITVDDLGDSGFDAYYGYGRVNARRAVEPLPSHDLLILNWKRPAYVEPGSSGIINATVVNFGSSNEAGITVQLRVNGNIVDSAYISYLESMKSVTVSCSWSPTVEGRYHIESYVVPVSGETEVENNVRSAYVNVRVGKFIRVPEDCSTIQGAVDLSSPRETIKVASGTYYEHVSIDTSLKLVGEDRNTTIIDGNGTGAVVWVEVDNVMVEGFTVQNSGRGLLPPRGGIVLSGVKNCVVTNNTLINDFEGILLWQTAGNNSVYGNIAFSNEDAGIGSVGRSAGRDTIRHNVVTGGQFGVAIVTWLGDPSIYNIENTVSHNMISNSDYGICICSDNNTIVNNHITLCSSYGIWLIWKNNNITDNRVEKNEVGILLDYSWSNTIYHNDFIHNTVQVNFSKTQDPNSWDNGYPSGGNHWNDYVGNDTHGGPHQNQTGSDGIGDTPYVLAEDNIDRYPVMHPLATPFYGPWAKFTYSPKTPYMYETVTFDASTSLLGWNGTTRVPIANYTWDFDDGNITTVTNPVISHVFMAGTVYAVNLTVTCDDSTLTEKGITSDSTWQDVPVAVIVCIIIRADGSVFPPAAPISSVDNGTYTFTGNINTSIVVERDNIVVDGAGYTVQGRGSGIGMDLTGRNNVTNKNMEIKAFNYGVFLNASSNNIISGNNVTNNWKGICLRYSSNNSLSGNVMNDSVYNIGVYGDELSHFMHSIDVSNLVNGKAVYYLVNQKDLVINPATHPPVGYLALVNCANVTVEGLTLTNNEQGLPLANTNNSRIRDNNIADNCYGVCLITSCNNHIYHNNFVNNEHQVYTIDSANVLDNGYPSGGNYWSDYTDQDFYIGPDQDEEGSDGMWDNPYIINANNRDRYPLTKPYGGPYDIGITNVTTSKTVVGQGHRLSINVKILNYGADTETFNFTLYANTTVIHVRTVSLTCRNSTTVTFTWNTTGFAKGNYRISAHVTPVLDETDTADNTLTDGTVTIVHPGDLNNDGVVDIADVILVTAIYRSKCGDLKYRPNSDIIEDCIIDIADVVAVTAHYRETDP